MTTTAIIITIILSVIKLLASCLPTSTVNWILKKFELHFELSHANTSLTIQGKRLEGEDKQQVIEHYNEAKFLKKQHIFPGNERLFLQREDGGTPLIVDTKQGKKDIRLHVFIYNDHIDVVKQYKKKLAAYTLSSDNLQERSMQLSSELA
ncbi:YfmQ family protein [Peribacillus sp. SI8-4]|uniref:YfmQ family protein n=1 Tax=Peribacillus sp. SI8-4 TaxID=3048009 RepID=UPI0025536489|nr:YfmQ family protein [Peribacillus sp. SI8-4]